MSTPRSPLAPDVFPTLPPVGGVRLAVFAAGLRYHGRDDLFLAELAPATSVAGVFTRSMCASAPVEWCREILPGGTARAVICNAGNANAFTGSVGRTSAELTASLMAQELGCSANEVFLTSTGVIGEPLDDAAIASTLPRLASAADANWEQAALAIGTTDTFAKGAGVAFDAADTSAAIAGIAKGSGMIAPDMATMLGFVFTDLDVSPSALQEALSASVDRSFNRITVDSDTSTSDTVLAFATGASGNQTIIGPDSSGWLELTEHLDAVTLSLAHQIVKDGEGATKFVEVRVTGAANDQAAKAIALSIGNSPLVKTAVAAEDANWGRIVMAVGKAGQRANRDQMALWIGAEQIAADGLQLASYNEDRATAELQKDEVVLTVDVGIADGSASIWTCDLTHGYIDINAGYRS